VFDWYEVEIWYVHSTRETNRFIGRLSISWKTAELSRCLLFYLFNDRCLFCALRGLSGPQNPRVIPLNPRGLTHHCQTCDTWRRLPKRRFLSAIKCSLIAFYALLICAYVFVSANAFAIALFVTVFVSQSSQFVNQPFSFIHSLSSSFVRSHKCHILRVRQRQQGAVKKEKDTGAKKEREVVRVLNSPQLHFVNAQWATDCLTNLRQPNIRHSIWPSSMNRTFGWINFPHTYTHWHAHTRIANRWRVEAHKKKISNKKTAETKAKNNQKSGDRMSFSRDGQGYMS